MRLFFKIRPSGARDMARRHTIHQAPHTRAPFYGEMIHMQINKVAFIGKGGVGLLYGSMIT